MPFYVNEDPAFTSPAPESFRERGQQNLVDLRVVGFGNLVQKGSRLPFAETHRQHSRRLRRVVLRFGVIQRQRRNSLLQRAGPIFNLIIESTCRRLNAQLLGPLFVRRCLWRERCCFTALERLISTFKIVEQDAPRHAIDHEVMNDNE